MSSLALVTGASSGIGKAFAERLAADGHDLIIVGRRRERLDALAASVPHVNVQVLAADLATDEGIEAVAAASADNPVSMLVNNAGVAHYMPFADLPPQKARELVYVKTLAPTLLSRAVLPGMLEAGEGTIINVAGMLAFSGPTEAAPPQGQRATYVESLAGTVAMSQVLSAELAGTGVTVHAVCPGIVATEFHEVQGMDLSAIPVSRTPGCSRRCSLRTRWHFMGRSGVGCALYERLRVNALVGRLLSGNASIDTKLASASEDSAYRQRIETALGSAG